jgi:hypothetical protein
MNIFVQQLKEQFTDLCATTSATDRYEAYSVFHQLGVFCAQHFGEERAKEILNTVDRIYQQDSLYIRNAVENEFLVAMAIQLDLNNLLAQLDGIPSNLWESYLKVIIETRNNNPT